MLFPILILAGGYGTRIRAKYPQVPKYLVPINGRPFAWHQLTLLKKKGFQKVVLCVGHQSDQVIDYIQDGAWLGLEVEYSFDASDGFGTGAAIKKASQNIASPFGVIYGDSYLDFSYRAVFKAFVESNRLGVMSVYRNDNALLSSNLAVENNQVIAYNKENPTLDMTYIDYGFSVFARDAFDHVNESAFDLSAVFVRLSQQKQLGAYRVDQRFYEVGSLKGIAALELYLQSQVYL